MTLSDLDVRHKSKNPKIKHTGKFSKLYMPEYVKEFILFSSQKAESRISTFRLCTSKQLFYFPNMPISNDKIISNVILL